MVGQLDAQGVSEAETSLAVTGKHNEATLKASLCQRDTQMATRATGSKPKLTGGVAQAVNTVHRNYRIAIRQNSQITPKFS